MTRLIAAALADRRGVAAAEYAVLAVGIVVVVALAAHTFGNSVTVALGNISLS